MLVNKKEMVSEKIQKASSQQVENTQSGISKRKTEHNSTNKQEKGPKLAPDKKKTRFIIMNKKIKTTHDRFTSFSSIISEPDKAPNFVWIDIVGHTKVAMDICGQISEKRGALREAIVGIVLVGSDHAEVGNYTLAV